MSEGSLGHVEHTVDLGGRLAGCDHGAYGIQVVRQTDPGVGVNEGKPAEEIHQCRQGHLPRERAQKVGVSDDRNPRPCVSSEDACVPGAQALRAVCEMVSPRRGHGR
jgi:hypothetical protein